MPDFERRFTLGEAFAGSDAVSSDTLAEQHVLEAIVAAQREVRLLITPANSTLSLGELLVQIDAAFHDYSIGNSDTWRELHKTLKKNPASREILMKLQTHISHIGSRNLKI